MKKTKKLLAILAAMAMAMSPISVLADTNPLPAEDSNTNIGNVEGAIKEELISVTLPTINDEAFNFVLDPQLLMERTNSENSNKNGLPVVTKAGASVYFKNADIGASGSYAVSSTALSVTNKSSVEINVSVKAELKMASGDAIKVVSSGAAEDIVTGSALNLSIGLKNVSTGAVSYIAGKSNATCEAVATATMAGLSADNFKPSYNASKGEYEYVASGSAAGTTTAFVFEGSCNTNKDADWTKVKDMQANLIVVWNITQGGGIIVKKGDTVEWTDTTQPLVLTIDTASFGGSQLTDMAFGVDGTLYGYNGTWSNSSNLKDVKWITIDGNTVTFNLVNAKGINIPESLKDAGDRLSPVYIRLDGRTTLNDGTFTLIVP